MNFGYFFEWLIEYVGKIFDATKLIVISGFGVTTNLYQIFFALIVTSMVIAVFWKGAKT